MTFSRLFQVLTVLALCISTQLAVAQSQSESITAYNAPELELNGGEKWQIDSEMMTHIRDSEEILRNFIRGNKQNYQALSKQLTDANTNLIMSCSMTGKAHDLLHKWLNPHLKLVSELEKAETDESAEVIVSQLTQSFDLFNRYFR
jgi:hypothetical protein